MLLNASGTKFGKTAGGDTIWLDGSKTSPYAFYQYWLNTDDRDVGTYLRWFTLLARAEIEALEADLAARPEGRAAAARARTRRDRARARCRGGDPRRAGQQGGVLWRADSGCLDPCHAPRGGGGFLFTDADVAGGPLAIAVSSGLFASNGEARRAIAQGGLSIGDERVAALDSAVPTPVDGEWLLVRAGKRRLAVGRLT